MPTGLREGFRDTPENFPNSLETFSNTSIGFFIPQATTDTIVIKGQTLQTGAPVCGIRKGFLI
jgi:hypothetical protein